MSTSTMFFYALCFLLLAILLPLFIYGMVKRKTKTAIAAVALLLCIAGLLYLFPTQFPYADSWILGSTREQIVSVYGEPTGYDHGSMISYKLGNDNGFFGVMSSNNELHYYIYFDGDGIACEILSGCQLGG